jgi:hypothetical protein
MHLLSNGSSISVPINFTMKTNESSVARYCHPREEHLLPQFVCYGVAGTAARKTYEMEVMGKMSSANVG